ncbi:uncharacterized protein BKA55DRAFT_679375 [Fusarium redolens]|uniref:Uncharacterized protein n=1 Tax=Fusarium redolens TaxID=48865 RepID=A0A9P9GFP1_FUSRE|nr:uncharacterized protein BKA55DRAFT_679375 [Fusarium redolens]KAH7237129.1 hypothetical protein BKA55DRAFT_679375 [Fusarium redolens]
MASFRRFPDLPKELREMIFDLQKPEPNEESQTSIANPSAGHPPKHELASPLTSKYFPAPDGSTGNSNVSTYMADIGLWTACKESRFIMEKDIRASRQGLEHEAKQPYRRMRNVEDLPAMGCFFGSSSQRFMVRPLRDLFALQPANIDNIDWPTVARDILKQLSPTGFGWHIDIGIEWDREWGIRREEEQWGDDLNVICDAFHHIDAHLWIIDHNLNMRGNIDKNSREYRREAFYTCDRKLIEVDWGHKPLERWRHIKPPGDEKHGCSIGLAKTLDSIADDEHGQFISYGQYGQEPDRRFASDVKLLGWDDL